MSLGSVFRRLMRVVLICALIGSLIGGLVGVVTAGESEIPATPVVGGE